MNARAEAWAGRPGARRVVPVRVLWLGAILLAAASCRATSQDWLSEGGRLETVPAAALPGFEVGRALLSAGNVEAARAEFEELVARFPDDLHVATWLQEAELAELGGDTGGRQQLRERYRELAEARPTAYGLLLAARIEDDPFAARNLLRRALELDPDEAWVHYGLAHVGARLATWNEARASLARALELEPLHLSARRLEAWMLARSGRVPEAVVALQRWLPRAEESIFFSDEQLSAARIDLALFHVLNGEPRRAAVWIRDLERNAPLAETSRRLMVSAGVGEALNRPQAALEAAAEAELRDPESLLPVVQQALLYEDFLDDPEAARAAWHRVLARAKTRSDLMSILQRTRARMRLESAGDPAADSAESEQAGGPEARQ